MQINDSISIVTGASRGIGYSLSKLLIEKGGKVAGFARDEARLKEVEEELGEAFLPVICPVGDLEAVQESVKKVLEAWGKIDALINNAGIGHFGAIEELGKAEWDEMISTNVTGTFHCIREVVPKLKEQGQGHIINVASIAGLVGNPNLGGYNASKFAVRGLGDALFQELRNDGIKVTTIYPGSVQTSFSSIRKRSPTKNKLTPEEVAEVIVHCLERSDNFLIDTVVLRPLKPNG